MELGIGSIKTLIKIIKKQEVWFLNILHKWFWKSVPYTSARDNKSNLGFRIRDENGCNRSKQWYRKCYTMFSCHNKLSRNRVAIKILGRQNEDKDILLQYNPILQDTRNHLRFCIPSWNEIILKTAFKDKCIKKEKMDWVIILIELN